MNKKSIYVFFASVLLLTGCSEKEASQSAVSAESVNEPPAYYEDYVKNPQIAADQSLQEIGQTASDDKGELKLEAVNMEAETHEIGDIKLTVREAKHFYYKPSYGLIDFYHSYTHDTEFNVVKLFVEIENTSDKPVHFAPVALLETGTGETKLWEDDIYLEELNGEIDAGETKKGNLGFIVEKTDFESMVITTSDLFDENNNVLVPAEQFTVKF